MRSVAFQSILRKRIRKLPKFLKILKIIQFYSILFNRVLRRDGGARRPARGRPRGPRRRPRGPPRAGLRGLRARGAGGNGRGVVSGLG